jgi:alpha-N-acetylglucosaminidase
MDVLLATRKDFMLGPWLAAARSHGTTPAEKALYEQNARDLITLWGGANSPLHEYSNRQWSGLLNDFYKPRWQQFFALLQQSLRTGTEPDLKQFDETIRNWEWKWVKTQKSFPVSAIGDPVKVSKQMYDKYRNVVK